MPSKTDELTEVRPDDGGAGAGRSLAKALGIAGGILAIAGTLIAALLWLFSVNATANYAKDEADALSHAAPSPYDSASMEKTDHCEDIRGGRKPNLTADLRGSSRRCQQELNPCRSLAEAGERSILSYSRRWPRGPPTSS